MAAEASNQQREGKKKNASKTFMKKKGCYLPERLPGKAQVGHLTPIVTRIAAHEGGN